MPGVRRKHLVGVIFVELGAIGGSTATKSSPLHKRNGYLNALGAGAMQRQLVSGVVLIALVCGGAGADESPPDAGSNGVSRKASFSLHRVDIPGDAELSQADYAGKTLILEFWTTWCLPCRPASDHLDDLYEAFRDQGLEVLGVSPEDKATVAQFIKRNPATYPIAIDRDNRAHEAFDITRFPTAVLINTSGEVLWRGNPNDLTANGMKRVLDTGEPPPSLKSRKRKPRGKTSSAFEFSLDIAPASEDTARNSSTLTTNSRGLEFRASKASATELLRTVLEVSPQRVHLDSSHNAQMYAMELSAKNRLTDAPIDRELIGQLVASAMGFELRSRTSIQDVLILRAGADPPKRVFKYGAINSGGRGGTVKFSGAQVDGYAGLLQYLEADFQRYFVNETGLESRYEFSYTIPSDGSLDVAQLAQDLGLRIEEEKREVRDWQLIPRVSSTLSHDAS